MQQSLYMSTFNVPGSFSNLQQELLNLYANNVSDADLYNIKSLIGNYFAAKASDSMDEFLAKNNIAPEAYNNWANEHNRSKGGH